MNFCLACLAEDRTQGFCMLGKCSSTERHPDPLGELLMATAAVELLLFSSMFFYYKYSISLSQASSSQFWGLPWRQHPTWLAAYFAHVQAAQTAAPSFWDMSVPPLTAEVELLFLTSKGTRMDHSKEHSGVQNQEAMPSSLQEISFMWLLHFEEWCQNHF